MIRHARLVRASVVIAAGIGALVGCTPSSAPPPAGARETPPAAAPPGATPPAIAAAELPPVTPPDPAAPIVEATPMTTSEPASPAEEESKEAEQEESGEEVERPAPPRRPPRGRKRCLLDSASDPPTRALAAALRYLTVDAAFTCPATFRLVQRRPWVDDFEFGRATGRARELFTFAGLDEATGDILWVTLGRSDKRGFHGSACGVPNGFRRGWYCVASTSRLHDEAEPLRAWLAARGDEVHALDWLALALPIFGVDEVRWRDQPRVLHIHEGRDVTLCWQRGKTTRCWRLADVDRSELEDRGYADALELVTTTAGVQRRWRITASGGLRGRGLTAWARIDPPALELAAAYSARVIRTVRDGAVVLGEYEEIGHGGVDVVLMARWVLLRGEAGWSATPLPDAVVDDVLVAGDSLAITAVHSDIGDGPHFDHYELLTLAAGPRGREFAGQLESQVGEDVVSHGGEYSWRYTITSPGPDCVRLAPGPVSGYRIVFTGDEEEDGTERRLRARDVFGQLDGDWSITTNGPRRGCPPSP